MRTVFFFFLRKRIYTVQNVTRYIHLKAISTQNRVSKMFKTKKHYDLVTINFNLPIFGNRS